MKSLQGCLKGDTKILEGELQQIAIKRVYVQNAKTLSRLDLVTKPCGGFDRKSL